MSHRVAVDIGGSHVTAALVDMDGRRVLIGSVRRQHVEEALPAADILDAWSEVCLAAADAGPTPEGLGQAPLQEQISPVPCVLSPDPESSTLLGAAAHWAVPARVPTGA